MTHFPLPRGHQAETLAPQVSDSFQQIERFHLTHLEACLLGIDFAGLEVLVSKAVSQKYLSDRITEDARRQLAAAPDTSDTFESESCHLQLADQ